MKRVAKVVGDEHLLVGLGVDAALGATSWLPPYYKYRRIGPLPLVVFGVPTIEGCGQRVWAALCEAIADHEMVKKIDKSEYRISLFGTSPQILLMGLNEGGREKLKGSGIYLFLGCEWQNVSPHIWGDVIEPSLSGVSGSAAFLSM